MKASDVARAALDAARADVAKLREAEAEAARELEAAEQRNADDGTDGAAAAVLTARERRELVKVKVDGAAKRVERAEGALRAAELQEAREELAASLPLCDRAPLFARLKGHIATLAEAAPIPRVDIFAPSDETALAAALDAQSERDLTCALAHRAIRREVAAQHAAVERALSAAKVCGERAPAVAKVPEQHITAAIMMETHAASVGDRPDYDQEFWAAWWLLVYPGTTYLQVMGYTQSVFRGAPAGIAWARDVITHAADPFDIIAKMDRAKRYPTGAPAAPVLSTEPNAYAATTPGPGARLRPGEEPARGGWISKTAL